MLDWFVCPVYQVVIRGNKAFYLKSEYKILFVFGVKVFDCGCNKVEIQYSLDNQYKLSIHQVCIHGYHK